jgi:hypothetical protein
MAFVAEEEDAQRRRAGSGLNRHAREDDEESRDLARMEAGDQAHGGWLGKRRSSFGRMRRSHCWLICN